MTEKATAAHFTGLRSAEERHRASPHSFSIPRSDVRRSLERGSLVKLLFSFSGADAGIERMWVEVVDVRSGRYVGRLENEPTVVADLRLGDQIEFAAEHVAAIWREMPRAPRPQQIAIVSNRIWLDGASPSRAMRRPTPDDGFSGWIIWADDDGEPPPQNPAGFQPITHHELAGRYRSFDSIEDEPVDTRWRWDDEALEWVLDEVA